MRIHLFAILSLYFAFFSSAPARAESFDEKTELSFVDTSGMSWKRWVLTEEVKSGYLLLVVDKPMKSSADNNINQRVVYRKFFPFIQKKVLLAATKKYISLKDHPEKFNLSEEIKAPGKNPLWVPVRNYWTEDDEKDYSNWYTANVNESLLVGSGIIVDCADFAITVRWIYAHDHLLPVANTLAGSGDLFGQWSTSSDWDNLPTDPSWQNDERFKAGLKFLLSSAFTHTIIKDLYPVALSKDYVAPGSILLILYSQTTGHTEVINGTGPDQTYCPTSDCITVLYGNEPAAETAYKDQAWIVNGGQAGGGFLRWRWPSFVNGKWTQVAATQMPGYSLEQYSQPNLDPVYFQDFVYQKLGLSIDLLNQATLMEQSLMSELDQRQAVSSYGYLFCYLQSCTPTDADNYSSPSRDKRLREARDYFLQRIKQFPPNDPGLANLIQNAQAVPVLSSDKSEWDYIANTNGVSDKMSPDPTKTIFDRWAITPSSDLESLSMLMSVWFYNWQSREYYVQDAQYDCFPNGGDQPSCDPKDPTIQALSTKTMDVGLRLLRNNLRAQFAKLNSADQNTAIQAAEQDQSQEAFCGQTNDQTCTLNDFLFADTQYIDKMSSDPLAPNNERFGY